MCRNCWAITDGFHTLHSKIRDYIRSIHNGVSTTKNPTTESVAFTSFDDDLNIDNVEYLDEEFIDLHDFKQAFESVVIKTEIVDDDYVVAQLEPEPEPSSTDNISHDDRPIGETVVSQPKPQPEPCPSDNIADDQPVNGRDGSDTDGFPSDNMSYDGITEQDKCVSPVTRTNRKTKLEKQLLAKWARYVRFKYDEYTCDICGKT